MKEEPKKPGATFPEWQAVLITMVFSFLIMGLITVKLNLVSGKPALYFRKELVSTSLTMPLCFYFLAKLGNGFKPLLETLPEGTETSIRSRIEGFHLENVSIHYRSGSKYPRPEVQANSIFLSAKLIQDCSTESITWMIHSELKCARKILRVELMTVLPCLVFALGLVAITVRFNQPVWGFSIAALMIFSCFKVVANWTLKKQLESDLVCTVTLEDRLAAKEILSYSYFAQTDRWITDKYSYSSSELEKRAENLGIELERGFRVERPVEPVPEATL